jgi:hypothetical protein
MLKVQEKRVLPQGKDCAIEPAKPRIGFMEKENMLIDDPKKEVERSTTPLTPAGHLQGDADRVFESHAGKKMTHEAFIEARIIDLFQKGLAPETYKQYAPLLWNENLKQEDPEQWLQAMSKILDIPEPEGFRSMDFEQQKLSALLLASYIDKARRISGATLSRRGNTDANE